MAGTTAIGIYSLVVAAGSATYSAVQSGKARDDAQGAADFQGRQVTAATDKQKADAQAQQAAMSTNLGAAKAKQDAANKEGYKSTFASGQTGLAGVGVTGGTQTVLGS